MIELIRALAWLRLRFLLNTLRSGAKRDNASRFSRFAEVASPILLALSLVPAGLGLTALALVGGWWIGSEETVPAEGMAVVRYVLALYTVVVLVTPLFSAMQGAVMAPTRLLLLPIPRRRLYVIQVAAGIGDPFTALMLPSLLAFPLGLAVAGHGLALTALVGGVAFIGLLLSLQSTSGLILQVLFQARRRAEWISLVLLLVLSSIGFLPLLLAEGRSEENFKKTFLDLVETFLSLLPSQLQVSSLQAHLEGRPFGALLNLVLLAVLAGLIFGLGASIHRRLLESGKQESAGKPAVRDGGRLSALLSRLEPGTAAVAEAQLRNGMRSTRGRLALFSAPLLTLLIGTTLLTQDLGLEGIGGVPVAMIAVAFSLAAFQPILFNLFGTDLSGLTLLFLCPLTEREIVRGKMVGVGLHILPAASLGIAAALIFDSSGRAGLWLAVPVLGVAAFLVAAPLSVLLSLFFPKAADLSHWGKGGNPHPMAGFLGMIVTVLALGTPALAAALIWWLTGSLGWLWLALSVWILLAALIGAVCERIARRVLQSRREELAIVAQGR